MTLTVQLDAPLAAIEQAGLMPSCLVLSFEQRRQLTTELHGSAAYHEPGQHPYALFVSTYRGLPIVGTPLAHDGALVVGVQVQP